MIQFCRKAFLCFVVCFICMGVPSVAAPAPGGGGTTVIVEGSTVTITVNMDLCCLPEDASQRSIFEPLVMAEIKGAQDMWNQALAKLPAKGCYQIEVRFNARWLRKGEAWDDGYHHITFDFTSQSEIDEWESANNQLDQPLPDKYRPGIVDADNLQNDDDDAPYKQQLAAFYTETTMTIGTFAHESGHLMGLGDDYFEKHGLGRKAYVCLPGREGEPDIGTLMCRSRTGIIDQNLVDRLADILNSDGLLPQCWIGTFKGHSEGNVYNDTVVVVFRFAVGSNGSVIKGKGLATMTHAPQRFTHCTFTRRVSPDQFDVNIGGTLEREPDALFKLELSTEQRATYQFTASACDYGSRGVTGPPVSGGPPFPASLKDFYHPQVPAKDGASSTWNGTNGTSGISNTSSIEIHEVRQTPIKQVQPDGRRQ